MTPVTADGCAVVAMNWCKEQIGSIRFEPVGALSGSSPASGPSSPTVLNGLDVVLVLTGRHRQRQPGHDQMNDQSDPACLVMASDRGIRVDAANDEGAAETSANGMTCQSGQDPARIRTGSGCPAGRRRSD